MRLWLGLCAATLLIGCGEKGEEDTGPVGSCEDYSTTLLSSVPNADWPEGLDASVTAYKDLGGLYEADHCTDDSKVSLKITPVPIEGINIIQSGVPADVACGCVNDLAFTHDNTYDPVALVPAIDVFVEPDPEFPIDPGIDLKTFQLAGAMFGPGQPLLYRGCQTQTIDPIDESDFDQSAVNFRIETNTGTTLDAGKGTLSLSIYLDTLEAGGDRKECTLTNIVKVSGS